MMSSCLPVTPCLFALHHNLRTQCFATTLSDYFVVLRESTTDARTLSKRTTNAGSLKSARYLWHECLPKSIKFLANTNAPNHQIKAQIRNNEIQTQRS